MRSYPLQHNDSPYTIMNVACTRFRVPGVVLGCRFCCPAIAFYSSINNTIMNQQNNNHIKPALSDQLASLSRQQLIDIIVKHNLCLNEMPTDQLSTTTTPTPTPTNSVNKKATSTGTLYDNNNNSNQSDTNDVQHIDKRIKLSDTNNHLQPHTVLRNNHRDIIDLCNTTTTTEATDMPTSTSTNVKQFDGSKYRYRYIALHIAYIGTNYHGFALQNHYKYTGKKTDKQQTGMNDTTVESELMDALIKLKLILPNINCKYARCGRTDKGVHAFKQIVSLYVRSALNDDTNQIGFLPAHINPLNTNLNTYQHSEHDTTDDVNHTHIQFNHKHRHTADAKEFNYAHLLNKILPNDIRILQWKAVDHKFHARFECNSRTYKYLFYRDAINTSVMKQNAQQLIGAHDFRNYCKPDPTSTIHYQRLMQNVDVNDSVIDNTSKQHCDDRCIFTIRGNAFLYHQVRCMTAVLFTASQVPSVDRSDLVRYLLDIEKCPNKPIYDLTSEQPLILWNCEYDDAALFTVNEHTDKSTIENLRRCYSTFHQQWRQQQTRADVLKQFCDEIRHMLNTSQSDPHQHTDITNELRGNQLGTHIHRTSRRYIPYEKRRTEKSSDERIAALHGRDLERRNNTLQLHQQFQAQKQERLKQQNPTLL